MSKGMIYYYYYNLMLNKITEKSITNSITKATKISSDTIKVNN